MMRKCHLNTCPVGVATQDPVLRKRFKGTPEHVINFFFFVAEEVRELLAEMGFTQARRDHRRSRTCWRSDELIAHWKARGLDFSRIFYKPDAPKEATHWTERQKHPIDDVLDRKLIELAQPALEARQPVTIELPIRNVDRSAGAMLSGEVAKRFGHKGLKDDTITVKLTGTAGQSFGAFLARGITFDLIGDGNDYVGKGLSGGRIVVRPPENAKIVAGRVDHRRQHRALRRDRGRVLFPRRRRRALRRAQLRRHRRRRRRRRPWLRIHDRRHRRRASARPAATSRPACRAASPMCSTRQGDFAERCNMAMVELEPVPEEDDMLEKLHHHGGDLEHKGRVDVSGDMTRHDEERLYQLISNHLALHRLDAGQGDPRPLGGLSAEIPQGHAGRIPPRAARDGTQAHERGGGVDLALPKLGIPVGTFTDDLASDGRLPWLPYEVNGCGGRPASWTVRTGRWVR